ncbi:MAG TPA: phenylalanine--tRNA ligase subunit beta [Candidatus Dojkabacteria bacterium]|nr:phenylalanine--tRNA ligase subunit beta [Candidatus Dojkabacteria bacterium]
MYIPLNWIKEYTDVNLTNEELVEEVSTKIGAVEEVKDLSEKYKDILTAEIIEVNDHPNADKLGVYKISIGKDKTVQVVAGDKTLKVGEKVAYFAPGVKVPYNSHPEKYDGIVTKVSLRGVDSEGMLASERELDLGADHNKVMRLDANIEPGQLLAEVFGLNDVVLDIENKALANRGDLFGILGIARELSGIQGKKFQSPDWYSTKTDKYNGDIKVTIKNEIDAYCKRYMAVVMDGVQVMESPVWMKVALSKVGIRPINNVVDITNYAMYLTSQPLHAFDLDKVLKVSGKDEAEILVRLAKEGETITTLDGKTVELDTNTMVITDGRNPIAIAGVMGGQSTEVDSNTKRILIECASFDRYNIRKTSMRLGLFTEAVTRFTKALDPNHCEGVLVKTIDMINDLAKGKVASKVFDEYAQPVSAKTINFTTNRLNTILGISLSPEQVKQYLENIEYQIQVNGDEIIATVPTFRQDIGVEEDIYEDVGRHYGYNNITPTLPSKPILPNSINPMLEFKTKLREIMTRLGGNELLTYNFTDAKVFEKYNISLDTSYKIINPLSPELEYMRYDLLPSLLEKVVVNVEQGYNKFMLYELNKGHSKAQEDFDPTESLPKEREYLGATIVNPDYKGRPYYTAKAVLEKLLSKLNVKTYDLVLLKDLPTPTKAWIDRMSDFLDIDRTAALIINQEYVGVVGEVHAHILSKAKLPAYTSILELDLGVLINYTKDSYGYIEPSRYPRTIQDFCFELPLEVRYKDLEKLVSKIVTDVDYVFTISPIDIFHKEESDKKRITLRLSLQHRDRTLTQYDITQLRNTLSKESELLGGKIV